MNTRSCGPADTPDDGDDLMCIIRNIQKDLSQVKSTMITKQDLKKIENKVDTLESKIDNAIIKADEASSTVNITKQEVKDLQVNLAQSNAALVMTKSRCDFLESRLNQLEDYSRRDNLIFDGITETQDEDCQHKVRRIMKEHLQINDADTVIFQRIHRLQQVVAHVLLFADS
jgi:predicted nuclease with TOPRIM domain